MLKSLFAALSILHLIDANNLIQTNQNRITPPNWYTLQQCKPMVNIDSRVTLFQIAIGLNQLTFALTSLLNHTRLGAKLSRPHRIMSAYILGFCSFVFGFGKVLLLATIPITAKISFPCPESTFIEHECNSKQFFYDDGFQQTYSCNIFTINVPTEIYVLSVTFVLTFVYSLFMCDQLLNRDEIEIVEVIRLENERYEQKKKQHQQQQQHQQPLNQPQPSENEAVWSEKEEQEKREDGELNGSVNDDDDDDEEDPEEDGSSLTPPPSTNPNHSPLTTSLLSDDGVNPNVSASSDGVVGVRPHRRRRRRPVSPLRALMGPARPPSDLAARARHDLVEMDPLSKKALQLAQGLSAQELLLCMVESDYRKHMTRQLKSRDLFYRLLRDLATLAKFILTVVSLCLIITNSNDSILTCSQHSLTFESEGIEPNTILNACQPAFSTVLPSYLFIIAGVGVAAMFTFIVIMEKRILAPKHSGVMSCVCIIGVMLLLTAQLILMLEIDDTTLVYPCAAPFEPPSFNDSMPSLTQYGTCDELQLNVTSMLTSLPILVTCQDVCSVDLGPSTYTLFASLMLSIVYMVSLTLRYHKLAKIFQTTEKALKAEMTRLFGEEPQRPYLHQQQTKAIEQARAKNVVLAILAKSD